MSAIATIGFFDGVHRGHRYLLEQLRTLATEQGGAPMIFTFLQHPRQILDDVCPPLLTTTAEREQLLELFGETHFLDFAQIQPLTAFEFLDYLDDRWKVRYLLMGYNHRFGSDHGSVEEAAERVGIRIVHADPFAWKETVPSSTRIRTLLAEGKVEEANELLGYHYTLTGKVVPGRQIGRLMGFPTANIDVPQEKLVPAAGVYEARVFPMDLPAMVNIGTNPTIGNSRQTVEVHIPQFEQDLYGTMLSVQLRRFIRHEQRFDSLLELQEQISRDLTEISTKI